MNVLKTMWRSRWIRAVLVVVLAIGLWLLPAGDAWARSGGRIGGGSFRARYNSPRVAPAPLYGGGYGGGFPLLMPFFFGGGGGFLTLLVLLGAGSFLLRAVRSGSDEAYGGEPLSTVQVAEVKVGLLASARDLQKEIDALALSADTSGPVGLSRLLQDVSLSLTRHDDYWVYGQVESKALSLQQAEQFFYQQSLQERSKFSAETLVNIGKPALSSPQQAALTSEGSVGEYLVVTLLVAHSGALGTLPVVNSAAELRRCLMQLGSLSAERLMAVEVLWTPQQEGDTLTAEELLTEYPQLRRL